VDGCAASPCGPSRISKIGPVDRLWICCGQRQAAGSGPRPNFVGELVGVPRAFGVAHLPGPLRDNCCSASKLSAALWSNTSARCLAFSSGHVSTVDSVPSGAIRTTCHPMALASYRSRFILRICAPTRPFSSPEVCHNRHRGRAPVSPRLGQAAQASPALAPIDRLWTARNSRTHHRASWSRGGAFAAAAASYKTAAEAEAYSLKAAMAAIEIKARSAPPT
jgi:hypothetical protein